MLTFPASSLVGGLLLVLAGFAALGEEPSDSVLSGAPTLSQPRDFLTQDERLWIEQHPVVRFTGDPNWLPYEAFDDAGRYIGIVSEHLDLISNKTGLRFDTIPVSNWSESLRIATEGKVSVISGDAADAILNQRFLPVDAYSHNPIVIIMDHQQGFVTDLDDIEGRRIAIIKDYGYTADIFRRYPHIKFDEVENIQEGLTGVSEGRFDAMLATMALASYHIAEMGVHNVKVVGKTPIIMDLTLFVSKDLPVLHSIINKTLKTVTKAQSQDILQGWVRSKYVEKTDYLLVFQVALALILLTLFVFIWNRRLKTEVEQRKATEQALRLSEERYDLAMSVANDGIWDWDVIAGNAIFDRRYYTMAGYEPNEFPSHFDEWRQRIHPEDLPTVLEKVEAFITEQIPSYDVEFRFLRKDGDYMWIRGHGRIVERDAQGNPSRVVGTHSDVTARRNAQEQIRLLSAAVEQSPVSVVIADTQGRVEYVNRAFEEISGFPSEAVLGQDISNHSKQAADADGYFGQLARSIASGREWSGEQKKVRDNGEAFWERSHIKPVVNDLGVTSHFMAINEDVSLHKTQEEQIIHQAHYDSLTDLPNRFLVLDRLEKLVDGARRLGRQVGVLFLDLDDFKKINDSLGHHVGDKLLIEAADRLRGLVRDSDTVGRLGGDEFIVLLGDLDNVSGIQTVADGVIRAFNDPFQMDGEELLTTASVGISVYPVDGENAAELLRKADAAMYASKGEGKGTFSFFTQEMNRQVERHMAVDSQMQGALDRGELYVVYQPQVDIATGQIHSVEALLRWENPLLGSVSPEEFIPLAEQSGQIVALGKYVLEQTIETQQELIEGCAVNLKAAVNLSPRQLRDAELVEYIEGLLTAKQRPAADLELEITEGVLMTGQSHIVQTLMTLSDLGISISLDDFGTGYSSLSYLRAYPFDVLKIDRSFVRDLMDDNADRELVHAAIEMAHALSLKVVAEGVETEDQLEVLSFLKCDYAQGYLLSKPLDRVALLELMESAREKPAVLRVRPQGLKPLGNL